MLHMTHLLKLLDKMCNMKWIRRVFLKIQSGHDSVHRLTDGQTNRWSRWNQYTPPPLSTSLKWGVKSMYCFCVTWIHGSMTNMVLSVNQVRYCKGLIISQYFCRITTMNAEHVSPSQVLSPPHNFFFVRGGLVSLHPSIHPSVHLSSCPVFRVCSVMSTVLEKLFPY